MLEKFLRASLDMQDILFSCEEVLSRIPSKAQELGKELDPFVSETLPTYLSTPQRLEILTSFRNMQKALLKNQIDEAKEQLALVHENIGAFFSQA